MLSLSTVLSTRHGCRRKFEAVFVRNVQTTEHCKWLWIDSNGKIETRNPADGYFDGEFPAICNHCGILAVWSRKTLKCFKKFLRYFGKTTTYGKSFKNAVPKVFITTSIDVLCTIRYGTFRCSQKLAKGQVDLAHGTKNGKIRKKLKNKNLVVWKKLFRW